MPVVDGQRATTGEGVAGAAQGAGASTPAAFEPKILAFACHWCTYSGADLAGLNRMNYPANVRLLRVPCSGRVNPQHVLAALNKGADGVLVCGCHPGDCHYVSGNYFAKRRLMAFKRLLEYTGLEPERFQVRWISGSEAGKFRDTVIAVCEQIRALGPYVPDGRGDGAEEDGGSSILPPVSSRPVPPVAPLPHIEEQLRTRAAELLESGEVAEVIAWGAGRFANQTTPLFVSDAARAQAIVCNEYCVNTLAKYALTEKNALAPPSKIAVAVRGCEARGINRMIADKQIAREDLYLLGIPCGGVKDRVTGETLARCLTCTHPEPVVYDEILGDEAAVAAAPDSAPAAPSPTAESRFAEVAAIEARGREQRRAHFDDLFSRCIRCYACREVCPVCTCRECFVDQQRAGWQGKQNKLNENRFYNLTRVFHVGDRCIECGECARACPMNLPLMELNRKMTKDLTVLFAAGEEGLSDELDNALGRYDVGDVEEFM